MTSDLMLRHLIDVEGRLCLVKERHRRETCGDGGEFCTECCTRWPCDTYRMTEGTYVDREAT